MIARRRVVKAARRKSITMGKFHRPKRRNVGDHNVRSIGGVLFEREVPDGTLD